MCEPTVTIPKSEYDTLVKRLEEFENFQEFVYEMHVSASICNCQWPGCHAYEIGNEHESKYYHCEDMYECEFVDGYYCDNHMPHHRSVCDECKNDQ